MEFRAPDHHHQHQDQMRSATSATSTLGFTHQAADRRRSLVSAAHNGNNTSTMTTTTTTNTTTPSGCTNTNTQTLDARPLQQVQPARVKYRECLKNHAASAGGSVFDGCGEFMPSGEDGSLEALKCAACTCHRNFHRKDLDGGGGQLSIYSPTSHITTPPPPPLVQPMNVAYGGGGVTESSSEELNANSTMSKKRFRTKFTREQKDRMLEFAERVGWRFQKQDDELVDQFCSDVGVRRQVLKVWMHNNKSNNLNANHRHHHVSILMVNPTTTTTTATTDVVAMNHQASDDDNEEALDP